MKGRREGQREEEGQGRKEEGQMTYQHKTVQTLIKTGNRTEVWRAGGLVMHLVNVLAHSWHTQALGGVPLGPLSGHPVVLGSVGHVLCGNTAHQRVGRVAVCEE